MKQPPLTPRHLSVVRLIPLGLTNREIATILHISHYTVNNYLEQIYDRLGLSNRVELAMYAVHNLPEDRVCDQ